MQLRIDEPSVQSSACGNSSRGWGSVDGTARSPDGSCATQLPCWESWALFKPRSNLPDARDPPRMRRSTVGSGGKSRMPSLIFWRLGRVGLEGRAQARRDIIKRSYLRMQSLRSPRTEYGPLAVRTGLPENLPPLQFSIRISTLTAAAWQPFDPSLHQAECKLPVFSAAAVLPRFSGPTASTAKCLKRWCRQIGLNYRPHPYQGCALPLSYGGLRWGG